MEIDEIATRAVRYAEQNFLRLNDKLQERHQDISEQYRAQWAVDFSRLTERFPTQVEKLVDAQEHFDAFMYGLRLFCYTDSDEAFIVLTQLGSRSMFAMKSVLKLLEMDPSERNMRRRRYDDFLTELVMELTEIHNFGNTIMMEVYRAESLVNGGSAISAMIIAIDVREKVNKQSELLNKQ